MFRFSGYGIPSHHCISKTFLDRHLQTIPIHPVGDLLRIEGAGGQEVPFIGYIEASLTINLHSTTPGFDVPCLLLVVPETSYNRRVPVIVGTNVIKSCQEERSSSHHDCITAWSLAFSHLVARDRFFHQSSPLNVKATNISPLTVEAHQTTVLWGAVRTKPGIGKFDAYTESSANSSISSSLTVIPCVVSIADQNKLQHIPVQITNTSDRPVRIHPKSIICGLHSVDWVGSTSSQPSDVVQSQPMTTEFLPSLNMVVEPLISITPT